MKPSKEFSENQLFKAVLLNLTLNTIDIYIWASCCGLPLQSRKRNWCVFWGYNSSQPKAGISYRSYQLHLKSAYFSTLATKGA